MSSESGVSYQKNGGNGAAPNGNGGKIWSYRMMDQYSSVKSESGFEYLLIV